MNLKINWGWSIGIVYVLFASGMIYLVTLCTRQNSDLVSKNYYEKEIKYQQQYDKEKNALALSRQLQFQINSLDKTVAVIFPESKQEASLKGEILFQKPDDATEDKTIAVLTQSLQRGVSFKSWKKGLYKVEVNWSDGSKEYFKQSYLKLN